MGSENKKNARKKKRKMIESIIFMSQQNQNHPTNHNHCVQKNIIQNPKDDTADDDIFSELQYKTIPNNNDNGIS